VFNWRVQPMLRFLSGSAGIDLRQPCFPPRPALPPPLRLLPLIPTKHPCCTAAHLPTTAAIAPPIQRARTSGLAAAEQGQRDVEAAAREYYGPVRKVRRSLGHK